MWVYNNTIHVCVNSLLMIVPASTRSIKKMLSLFTIGFICNGWGILIHPQKFPLCRTVSFFMDTLIHSQSVRMLGEIVTKVAN
jgi:hypothetical protein